MTTKQEKLDAVQAEYYAARDAARAALAAAQDAAQDSCDAALDAALDKRDAAIAAIEAEYPCSYCADNELDDAAAHTLDECPHFSGCCGRLISEYGTCTGCGEVL